MSRRCPAVDPDDHHLYASLGCAAEHLLIAARATGLRGHLSYRPREAGVRVDFEEAAPSRTDLLEAIPRRQCSRSEYVPTVLTAEQLQLLEAAGRGYDVSVKLLTDRRQMENIAEYVAAGNIAQIADPAWTAELKSWIRFNAREAARTGDGLYGAAMGSPDVPRWLGALFMRLAFSAKSQSRKDIRYIRSSAAVATAFINQQVEVRALRAQLAAFLGIGHRRPDLVVRIGRGPEMPRSLRRPVEAVLV